MNHKRVERIWRQEGLKVPSKQPKRGRLWLTDGSCIRLRSLYQHHVWAYDFVSDRTHDGRPLKMLTVLGEYSRECLAIVVARRLQSDDVLQTLSELFVEHGPPANLRSDNGPEFTARVVRQWLGGLGVKTLFIAPGSPWENGYNESFNGTFRQELLRREIFYSLQEAKVLIEQWRREYNTVRPHSSLGYLPPAPEAILPDPKLLNLPLLLGPHPPTLSVKFVHEIVTGHARDLQHDLARTGFVELPVAAPDQSEVEDAGLGRICLTGVAVRIVGERGGELHQIRLPERF